MKPYSIRHFIMLLGSITILTSCDKKKVSNDRYEFDPEIQFDGNLSTQSNISKDCGKDTSFLYTIKTDDALAVFEVENSGSCDLDVKITHEAQSTTTKIPKGAGEFTIPKGNPSITNVFSIKDYAQGSKLRFTIKCKQSTSAPGCRFYMKFSVAKKLAQTAALVHDSTLLNESASTKVPTTNGNKCLTKDGDEKVIKTINNYTNTDMILEYEAQNAASCQCDQFIAFVDPAQNGNQQAVSTQPGINGASTGSATLKAGKNYTIKLKCFSQVKPGACEGIVKNLKLTPIGNK